MIIHGTNICNYQVKRRAFALIRITKVALVVALTFCSGCDDLLDIPQPDTELIREAVFESDDTALAALAGVYNKLVKSSAFSGGSVSITVTEGVYADELISYAISAHPIVPFYLNSVTSTNPTVSGMWSDCYNMIYSANAVIEGLNSPSISADISAQLMGEALFMRAFLHFYLVNAFGLVPYIRTTDYEANSKVSRMPVDEVYNKIIEDLIQAKSYLKDEYPSANRVRVNKGTATAFLARVYLYNHNWENAEIQATEVIANSQYELLADVNSVFLKESKETIWQLIPPYGYTNEGSNFILSAPPTKVALKNDLVNTYSTNDLRKANWTNSFTSNSGLTTWYYPFKYKVKNVADYTEYSVVVRLAEQYLIRAEARAMQNDISGAQADINTIRNRAGLPNTAATTQSQLLEAIVQERQFELFTEWGHRFFDLKRWGKLDEVLGPIKANWDTTDALLPIPQSEILINPNLTQNLGY